MSETIALVILAIVIILFLTNWIPSAVTAMLGCVLFAVTGICSVTDAFSGLSNEIVILVFGMLVVGDALFSSGIAGVIGNQVLKISRGNETLLLLFACIVSAILSTFLSNVAVIVLMLAILRSAVMTSPNISLRNVCMPVSMGAMFGGACTLVGSTPQLTMQSILTEATGLEFKMFDFMYVGALLVILFLVYIMFFGYPIGKRLWREREEADSQLELNLQAVERLESGNKKQRISMTLIFIWMIIMFVTEMIPIALTSAIAAIMCIVTRCTTQKQIIKNMDWPVIIRLAGCLGIAKGLTASGCGDLIVKVFINMFGESVSPSVLLACSTILAMVISNFITNSTAILIVLPPVLSIAAHFGFSPLPFAMSISYAASLTFATPLANAQIGLTLVAGYKFSDYVKYNLLLEILVTLFIVLFTPIFFPF